MGLDMYLEAKKTFYDASWNKDEEQEESKICQKIREIIPEMYESGNLNSIDITFEIGYWRKANQIHNWFVNKVQKGKDDCGDYYVPREKLEKLLKLCNEILEKTKLNDGKVCTGYTYQNGKEQPILKEGKVIEDTTIAQELLPTQSGFFFGSTDYDEYYIADVKDTIKIIEKALQLPQEWSFYYNSSW